MTEIAASKEEVERFLRESQRALERARETQEDIDRTLRESRRRSQQILEDLRRAGVLRD
jgi:F0F1-type ATP synthase membrane subunit b/b'